eukprot:1507863-Karenia_brevis.AAC.1
MARSIAPVVQAAAVPQQRGFIVGRQFTDNILLIDTISRIYSNSFRQYGNAILAFFDFANAFPSVCLKWIFLVAARLQLPLGIQQFICALYDQCSTYIKHGGELLFMCTVRSGVLQGCPMASLLFVLAMDPFAQLFNSQIDALDLGLTCLCADDIGLALKSWHDLIHAYEIFQLADAAAGLVLKPKKCFLIPLSAPLSLHVVSSVRHFLASHTPKWVEFNVVATAEYLGVWLGPQGSTMQWTKSSSGYLERVDVIAQANVAPSLAVKAYNTKCATKFSYLAQFLPPPTCIPKLEKYAFTKLFK